MSVDRFRAQVLWKYLGGTQSGPKFSFSGFNTHRDVTVFCLPINRSVLFRKLGHSRTCLRFVGAAFGLQGGYAMCRVAVHPYCYFAPLPL